MKKTSFVVVSTLLVSGIILGGNTTQAEEIAGDSKSTIKMLENDGTDPGESVGPVDPTDPTIPVDPTDPDEFIPSAGPLRIDYISNIRFGDQKISGSSKTYHALFDTVKDKNGTELKVPSYVQVVDDRGTNVGWKLQVANTQFTGQQDSEEEGETEARATPVELQGSRLVLENAFTNNSNAPTIAPTLANAIQLNGNSVNSDVATAENDKGYGISTIAYGENTHGETERNEFVKLEIPGSAKKLKDTVYTSVLTWTLSDTPA